MPRPSRSTLGRLAAPLAAILAVPQAAAAQGLDVFAGDRLLSLCLAALPGVAPDDVWTAWSFAPAVALPLAAVLLVYAYALVRNDANQGAFAWSRPIAFLAGWALLAAALLSPLCRMSAALAWAHMVQHVILVALAPPLLVYGTQGLWKGRPRAAPPRRGRVLMASALYAAAIWGAHAPRIYEAALDDAEAHVALTFGLVAAGVLFWRPAVAAMTARQASESTGETILAVFAAMVQTGILGALLTFAPTPWYPIFAERTAPWGLSPLEDQQLAGLIMWAPMGAIYLVAGLLIAARLLVDRSPQDAR